MYARALFVRMPSEWERRCDISPCGHLKSEIRRGECVSAQAGYILTGLGCDSVAQRAQELPDRKSALGLPSLYLEVTFTLVHCLSHPPTSGEPHSQDDIHIEAAHVHSSIFYGECASVTRSIFDFTPIDSEGAVASPHPRLVKPTVSRRHPHDIATIVKVTGPTLGPNHIYSGRT